MLTTQIQVLLYIGNIQLVSCSLFVPVPDIVVKSHQTLEAILPYLPLSLTAVPEQLELEQEQQQLLQAPPSSSSSASSNSSQESQALVLSSRPTGETPLSLKSRHRLSRSAGAESGSGHQGHSHSGGSNTNRISPDSSIPATTCIKISLHPTPTFKFVKPKCPHLQQKHRNQRHFRQQQHQQQQQQQQQQQPPLHHSQSHSHSHRHSHSHSHSHLHAPSASGKVSLEYSSTATPSSSPSSTTGIILVKFTYPIPDAASSPTELVQVTGSFNAWQRTEPLARNQATAYFEIEVPINLDSLPADNKILYKFVLDGNTWVTDPAQQVERDFAGNLNNVLVLDRSSNNNDNKHADTPDATTQQHRQQEQEQEQEQDQDQSSSYDEQEQHSEETEEERIARVKQEDEDDRVIRELGGGLWGTPFFAVNDPVDLPEHFVAGSDQDVDNLAAEAQVSEVPAETAEITPVEAVIVAEKTLPAEATQVHPEAPVVAEVKNEKEALVQEDEDEDDKIIRQLGGGLWGTPYFQMNDPVALPEHFVEALDADTSSQVPESASVPATSQDQDQKEEESGVETLVVKDAVPEGPEVESASLHILTTAIRPIKRGESFIVEQSPEVDVEPHSQDKVVAHGPVDPLPATPLSVAASFTPSGLTDSHTTSLASSTQPSSINGDNDNDSVVLLTGQLMATAVGDAKPTVAVASESLDTDENVEVATPRISTGTTDADTQTSTTTDKGEKRKSLLWKKIKKALN